MISLQFKMKEVYHGLAECDGMLHCGEDYLIIEYQTKDGLVGMIKSGVKTLKIPFSKVLSAKVIKKWFTLTMVINTSSLSIVSALPGSDGGRIELKLNRQDYGSASEMISFINLGISEARLRDAENS
ncbi:MAG: hypothetical protein ACOC2K_00305 [Bacteroidota bacterium]